MLSRTIYLTLRLVEVKNFGLAGETFPRQGLTLERENNNMTYQQMEILQEAACRYGNQFFDIAYQALLNGAHLINCEKPNNRTSINHSN